MRFRERSGEGFSLSITSANDIVRVIANHFNRKLIYTLQGA